MLAAVGLGAYVAALFHLLTHAFFKALLFLSSGSVIQGVEHGHNHTGQESGADHGEPFDPQDMRNMGGLRSRMKVTYWVYLIGALSLAGIPPLAGFFSKDEILADASLGNLTVYVLLAAAAFLTAFYMGRQILLVFFGKARSEAAAHAVENPPVMTVPLMVLAGLTVVAGALNFPGLHSLANWLEHTLGAIEVTEFQWLVAGLSVALALIAIAFSWLLYGRRSIAAGGRDPLQRILGPVFVGMERKWWVDELYEVIVIRPYVALAAFLAQVVDWRFWHDWFHDRVLANSYNKGARRLAQMFDLRLIEIGRASCRERV